MAAGKQKTWIKSGFYSLLERIGTMAFGLGSVLILLRSISKEEFGTWVLFLTLSAFVEVARNGFIQNSFIRFYNQSEGSDKSSFFKSSFTLNFALTLLSILALLILSEPLSILWQNDVLAPMIRLYCVTTFVLVFFSQYTFLAQAHMDFKSIFWANFFRQGSFFTAVLILLLLPGPLDPFVLAIMHLFAAVIGGLVAWLLSRNYHPKQGKVSRKKALELFQFGKYVFGTNLGSMLYKSVDKMMLGALLNPAAVALYDLAIRVTNLIEIPTGAAASVIFPASTLLDDKDTDSKKLYYEKSVAAILALILPAMLFVALFPQFIIQVIGGENYSDSVGLLQVTLLFGLFIPFARQFGTLMDSSGRPQLNFIFIFLFAGVNAVFNYFFITEIGLMGAAYATLLSMISAFILHQVILFKLFRINFLKVLLQVPGLYLEFINLAKQRTKF